MSALVSSLFAYSTFASTSLASLDWGHYWIAVPLGGVGEVLADVPGDVAADVVDDAVGGVRATTTSA
jgi:hypothetical protein